jgi:hypothetical protein
MRALLTGHLRTGHVFLGHLIVGVVVWQASAGVAAQSLGDVARQEAERRRAVKAAGKVYTNDTLQPSDRPAPAPGATAVPTATPSAASADGSAGGEGAAVPAAPPAAPRDEKYWRARLEAARNALSRAQTFHDALQSRVNALSTDFVNRDDPAQRNMIAGERQKALAELERVKQEIVDGQKAIAAIQEDARKAGVPPGWVR